MYCYIYDSFLGDKKYTSSLNRLETRLVDLGINGRTEKMTLLKSFREVVEEAVKRGADTIIAVGNDATVSKLISFLPNFNVTLGIIPIGPHNGIAHILGIPANEGACDTLSARIVDKIDLGKVNDNYFISFLQMPAQKEMVIDCGNYHVSPLTENGFIYIRNFNDEIHEHPAADKAPVSNPKDGVLEAIFSGKPATKGFLNIFRKEYSRDSVFPFKRIKIKCAKECLPVVADGQITIKTPISVEVAPKKLKVIVGKNRMF